jgi:hypothetical protein
MVTSHFVYSNIGLSIKDFFFKHGSEGMWEVQTFTLTSYASGLDGVC